MKSLKQFIINVFSTRSVGLFLCVVTAIFLTVVLSSRYYLHHSIIENNVSKRDVFANKTIKIVDIEKTQKLKNELSKKVIPIFVPVQDDYMKVNLDKNIEKINSVRGEKIPAALKKASLVEYFNLTADNETDYKNIEYIVNLSDSYYTKLENATKDTLYAILDRGISENEIQENLYSLVKENSSKYLSSADYNVILFLIKGVIAPNIVVDEDATEISRKNALSAVKPVEVTFKAGSKIVSAGQPVSKVQKDALKQCGYNVIQLNASGIMGIFILVALAIFSCAYYIEKYEKKFKRKAHYALISLLMSVLALLSIALPPYDFYVLFLPVAAFTMLISIFLNTTTAIIATLSLLCAISLALQVEILVLVTFIFGAFATVFSMESIRFNNRLELTKVGLITSGIYVVSLTGAFFLDYNLDELNFLTYWKNLIAVIVNGFASSIIASGVLPLLESMFKISTPYGLLELANTNHPLLQKLQEKAPGTHHHSQMVAILAEAAAEAIGANPILTRIGALYHDVGKINRPLFFVENQSYYGIDNPHDQFSPKFSKMVITTHPRDGVEKAKEYNISPAIYPFILEHHGDSIASYFYNEAIKQEGAENVSEDEYRYNAPKPSSKESAIIMLADSVESAVRSLKNPTYEEIDAKINAIIKAKLLDGQLSDSPVTLKDLKTIAATFNRVLKGMHHQRIKYHEDMENIHNASTNEVNRDEN
ncbi:MAG: HDIG domain-containing protein [bacterium]|nr:HDIG domain-containing protein [bacterium]